MEGVVAPSPEIGMLEAKLKQSRTELSAREAEVEQLQEEMPNPNPNHPNPNPNRWSNYKRRCIV